MAILTKKLRLLRRGRHKPHSNKPEAAASGTIGSAKKLPTKHATPHIPKQTTPVGAVNSKGQKRFVDPTTGKDAYIDMKVGRVKGPRGLPVKG